MPTLFLVRGLPGSGKSTYINSTLRQSHPYLKHYEADMYFLNAKGEYIFNPKLLPQAHSWCLTKTTEALRKGLDVAVSNTFSQLWELSGYLELDGLAEVVVLFIDCSEELSASRNIHRVPAAFIEKMIARWEPYGKEVRVQI